MYQVNSHSVLFLVDNLQVLIENVRIYKHLMNLTAIGKLDKLL